METLIIGDSFLYAFESYKKSWLLRLVKQDSLKVSNFSKPGTGPLYPIDKFLLLEKDNLISNYQHFIFSWSEPTRLYHPDVPNLNMSEVQNKHFYNKKHRKIYKMASLWYDCFADNRIESLKAKALMFWFDNYLKESYSDKTIWHFFSWPQEESFDNLKDLNSPPYHYFEKGVNVLPSLVSLSLLDYDNFDRLGQEDRNGHLEDWKHDFVYDSVKNLKDYNDGDVLQMPINEIDKYRK